MKISKLGLFVYGGVDVKRMWCQRSIRPASGGRYYRRLKQQSLLPKERKLELRSLLLLQKELEFIWKQLSYRQACMEFIFINTEYVKHLISFHQVCI